jgi:hypothetical protein
MRRQRVILRLQFSLRLFLLAITAFAIGFPIWYRWPYQEVHEERVRVGGPLISRSVVHWQRQWGGKILMHGKREELQQDWPRGDGTIITTHYVRGKRQGPYTIRGSKYTLSTTGQYSNDMREGVWTAKRFLYTTTANYHRGKLDGPLKIDPLPQIGQTATIALFDAGKMISFNGQAVQDNLSRVLKIHAFNRLAAAELEKDTEVDFVETPIIDVIEYLSDKHNLPIVLDTKRVPDPDLPITTAFGGVDLASTLNLLTLPYGLSGDLRYGCVWITTAADAKDWHDPTGVAEIRPPEESALERAWNEPVPLMTVAQKPGLRPVGPPAGPAAAADDVLSALALRLNIEIDASAITPHAQDPRFVAVAGRTYGLAFRHVLAQLLYFTGCRCKLDGDKLVILTSELSAN